MTTTEKTEPELIDRFPVPRSSTFDPQPEYAELQHRCPVARVQLPSGKEAVLVTRHEHVKAVLDDERLSADERKPGYPFLYEMAFESPLVGTFMRTDGEEHYKIRRMLSKDFTVKRAAALRPEVQQIVDDCLDDIARHGAPADLVSMLAFPVPSRAICRLLGVPYEDRDIFETHTRAMINMKSTPEEVQAAMGAIFGYLDELVSRKEAEPTDDLISRLVAEELATGNLERQELVTICLILLVGGHETTATMIGLGLFALFQHPDQLDLLRRDPSLWPGAIEELLRHQTIVQAPTQRAVLEDFELDGETIHAGEGVLAMLTTANRDADAFPDPDRLDILRNARGHVAFSFGPHQCLGHIVAKMELEVVFRSLFDRFPNVRLAVSADEVPLRPAAVNLFGVEALPVTW